MLFNTATDRTVHHGRRYNNRYSSVTENNNDLLQKQPQYLKVYFDVNLSAFFGLDLKLSIRCIKYHVNGYEFLKNS